MSELLGRIDLSCPRNNPKQCIILRYFLLSLIHSSETPCTITTSENHHHMFAPSAAICVTWYLPTSTWCRMVTGLIRSLPLMVDMGNHEGAAAPIRTAVFTDIPRTHKTSPAHARLFCLLYTLVFSSAIKVKYS